MSVSTCRPGGLAGVWKGVMGVAVVVDTGLVFPLVSPVEVLDDTAVLLLCVAGEEEEEERRAEALLGAAGGVEEEAGRRRAGGCCLGGDVLEAPNGDGKSGREYVRRAGTAVGVSFGGAGASRCGDGATLGTWVAETEGAGVRGGGGEEVAGVSMGARESSSVGLGVSRGGLGVVGVEGSAAGRGAVPLARSPCSDWL